MLEIKPLQEKDYQKAIQFSIIGMNFERFMNNKLILNLYGRYFLDLSLNKATDMIAAYEGEELMGLMIVKTNSHIHPYRTKWRQFTVGLIDWIQKVFVHGASTYNASNENMKKKYLKTYQPDGEILLLAANPSVKGKGIGTFLLKELKRRYPNKEFFLFTDSGCTYQFYDHRGFEKVGSEHTILTIGKQDVPLECMLYRKRL